MRKLLSRLLIGAFALALPVFLISPALADNNVTYGTFVANGTSSVTVADTNLAIGDVVSISLNTVGGTVGAIPHVATLTAGTGFTVVGTASDTSTYNWVAQKFTNVP